MNLLDRYIFKSVLFTCVAAVGLFAFVLLVGNVMKQLAGYVLSGQIDPLTFAELLALLVPFVVTFALPMGVLTGTLLTLGRLSADSEITAMRASGISLWRVARPVLIMGILGMLAALFNNHQLMPWGRVRYTQDLTNAIRANPLSFVIPRTFIRDFPGVVVYVGEKQGSKLGDFWIWQLDKSDRVVRAIHAAEGDIGYDEAGNALVLTLRNARVEARQEDSPENFAKPPVVGSFNETEAVRLPLDKMYSRSEVRTKLDFLPWSELNKERERLDQPAPGETEELKKDRLRRQARVELAISERFNHALAVLSFAAIGVPLGIRVSRRETSANLGLAVGLALSYYVLVTAIGWLEKAPQWQPALLLFLPNLLFLGLAAYLFGKVEKR